MQNMFLYIMWGCLNEWRFWVSYLNVMMILNKLVTILDILWPPFTISKMLSLFTYIFVAWGAIWYGFSINLSTGCWKWCLMLWQKLESRILQTVHVHYHAHDTQMIQTFNDWPKWHCALWHYIKNIHILSDQM